jgi:Protein of unknown function DUF2625
MQKQAMPHRRSLEELLAVKDPAWREVQSWIEAAMVPVDVLPADETQRNQALLDTQVTIGSPMGAIVYDTGGLLIDKGWLRLLGSGHPKLPRSLPGWNQGRSLTAGGESLGFLLIADDVVGGFYALNGGAFGANSGEVFYFAPDTLCWEPMNSMGYSQFLVWSFSRNLSQFYEPMRWEGWESEVSRLNGEQAFSIYPPLWSAEGKNIAKSSRKPSPIAEIFALHALELPKQLRSRLE